MLREDELSGTSVDVASYTPEEVLRFGDDDRIVSILTMPSMPHSLGVPAVVILNAGVLHRVGPHRLHVSLARRLAGLGFPVLRLDLSGIGDSSAAAAAITFRQSAVADTRAAMDLLAQRLGTTRFVLFGVCSGADNSLATATEDDRVVGLALVDSYSYATTKSRLRSELAKARRLSSPKELARWTGRRISAVGARLIWRDAPASTASHDEGSHDQPQEGRVAPPLDRYRTLILSLLERHVEMLAVFSGSLYERYNDVDQIFEWLPESRGRLSREYYPSANHTFAHLDAQAALITALADWSRRFSRPLPGAAGVRPQ